MAKKTWSISSEKKEKKSRKDSASINEHATHTNRDKERLKIDINRKQLKRFCLRIHRTSSREERQNIKRRKLRLFEYSTNLAVSTSSKFLTSDQFPGLLGNQKPARMKKLLYS